MSNKVLPFYQDVEGFRLGGFFSSDAFRSCLNYKARPGDLFISGFPKCGTTWLQQIVALIHSGGKPATSFADFNSRTVFLEMCGEEGVDMLKKPGSIKTHLPFYAAPLSEDSKHIHIIRNPKDVVVSYYHHTCSYPYKYDKGEFSDFFDMFLVGENELGDFFDHVLGWYEHRNDPNVLFFTYEELKRDTTNMIKRIAEFMDEKYSALLEDETVLASVIQYSTSKHMKTVFNESATPDDEPYGDLEIPAGMKHFMKTSTELKQEYSKPFQLIRKGIIGDWRSIFTEEQNRRMDDRIGEKFAGTEFDSYWKSIGCI